VVDHQAQSLLDFWPNGAWDQKTDQLANGASHQAVHAGPVHLEVDSSQQDVAIETRVAKMWFYLK